MKLTLIAICGLALASCGKGGGESTADTPVEGIDMSGTYNLTSIKCATTAGVISGVSTYSNYTAKIVINKNDLTITPATPTCSYTGTQRIVFTTQNDYTVSNTVVSNTTLGACVQTPTLTTVSGAAINIVPTVVIDGPLSGATGSYIVNDDHTGIGFLTGKASVLSSPTDFCLNIYTKE